MIYQKTSAGLAEISAIQKALNFRQRQVLIMVDGKRGNDDLVGLIPQPNVQQTLAELHQLGYIYDLTNPASSIIKTPALRNEISAPSKQNTLSNIQISAIKAILISSTEQYLGIMGRTLKQKIESAENEESISVCTSQWHMAMRESKSGREIAGDLMQQVQVTMNPNAFV